MKKKVLLITVAILSTLLLGSTVLSACGETEEFPTWKIFSGITASFSDNGNYGFILAVEGNGRMGDYASKKDAPWYGKSGRVTEIEVSDGITYIGSNSFTDCATSAMILPESVTDAGENAFPAKAKVYGYFESAAENVYCYSEAQPTQVGRFWHFVEDVPTIWETFEQEKPAKEINKILFVGNSYTYYNDMPVIFESIAKAAGKTVTVESITTGSQNLSNWANSAHEDGARFETALTTANDYDIIVLQEQSFRPISNYSGFLSGAKALAERINATQKDCQIYLYETWGNPDRGYDATYGGSIPAMELKLRTAYESVAAEIGAKVSYVGKAFTYVWDTYDLENLGKKSDMWLYQDDNTHPLYLGSYLSACVHAATMLGVDPRTSTFHGQLDADKASLMQEIAFQIVFGS